LPFARLPKIAKTEGHVFVDTVSAAMIKNAQMELFVLVHLGEIPDFASNKQPARLVPLERHASITLKASSVRDLLCLVVCPARHADPGMLVSMAFRVYRFAIRLRSACNRAIATKIALTVVVVNRDTACVKRLLIVEKGGSVVDSYLSLPSVCLVCATLVLHRSLANWMQSVTPVNGARKGAARKASGLTCLPNPSPKSNPPKES
jgi:hypothetical protein